jgi:ribosome biogenesis protein NSA1
LRHFEGKIASGHADGSAYHFVVKDDKAEIIHEWREHRLTPKEKYVGLEITDKCVFSIEGALKEIFISSALSRGIFSCTSNGALLMMSVDKEGALQQPEFASLPTRLCDWHLSPDGTTLAYGGDEVDISVWNTEQAFSSCAKDAPIATGKKRKRQEDLFPAEIWRAKNVNMHFAVFIAN